MANLEQLKRKCEDKIYKAIDKANEHFCTDLDRIPIEWSRKMTSTGGAFKYRRDTAGADRIVLSEPLLKLHTDQFINEVPVHEVAHYIANRVYMDRCGHDHRWKSVMRMLGAPPMRTHSMERAAPRRETRVIAADCGCAKPHMITKKRATLMSRGKRYYCRKCHTTLTIRT